jgi:hypothetical protein
MTEYLIASRAAIIFFTSLAVVPAEILFDAIETELEHRGLELQGCVLGPAAGAREKDRWSSK